MCSVIEQLSNIGHIKADFHAWAYLIDNLAAFDYRSHDEIKSAHWLIGAKLASLEAEIESVKESTPIEGNKLSKLGNSVVIATLLHIAQHAVMASSINVSVNTTIEISHGSSSSTLSSTENHLKRLRDLIENITGENWSQTHLDRLCDMYNEFVSDDAERPSGNHTPMSTEEIGQKRANRQKNSTKKKARHGRSNRISVW